MASGFTPAAKRFRTANEATSVRKRGKELGIPWKDISQAQISKWLVVCLMGQSTARVGCRIRAESINLFMICLRDPGTGWKSPAFQQCSASKVACWGKRRYPLVCGWVHRSRTVPPTQGDTRPQGHHWKRRGVPFFLIVTGRVTREKQDWPWKVDPAVEWGYVGVHKRWRDNTSVHRQSSGFIKWI